MDYKIFKTRNARLITDLITGEVSSEKTSNLKQSHRNYSENSLENTAIKCSSTPTTSCENSLSNHQQIHHTDTVLKRPKNSFIIWSLAVRRSLSCRNPNLRLAEMSRLLGQIWKQLDRSEKLPYEWQALQERTEFFRQHPGFKFRSRKKRQVLRKNVKKKKSSPLGFYHEVTTNQCTLSAEDELPSTSTNQCLYPSIWNNEHLANFGNSLSRISVQDGIQMKNDDEQTLPPSSVHFNLISLNNAHVDQKHPLLQNYYILSPETASDCSFISRNVPKHSGTGTTHEFKRRNSQGSGGLLFKSTSSSRNKHNKSNRMTRPSGLFREQVKSCEKSDSRYSGEANTDLVKYNQDYTPCSNDNATVNDIPILFGLASILSWYLNENFFSI